MGYLSGCKSFRRPCGVRYSTASDIQHKSKHTKEPRTLLTAIILVNVERQSLAAVTKEILAVDGIVEVHAVVGEYDLAAIARVKDQQQLSSIIADKMCNQIPGITHTKTLLSLNAQYNYDAAAAYGME